MSVEHRRRRPRARETLVAAGVAAGAAAAAFYLVRTLLAREPLEPRPPIRRRDREAPAGEPHPAPAGRSPPEEP